MTEEESEVSTGLPRSGQAARTLAALMTSQAVSVAGTQVTALALPTLAILVLHAGPMAASLLFALEYGIQGLTVPLAGVLVDHVARKRKLLVSVDLVQMCVIASVPLLHTTGHLTIAQLYGVSAVSGTLGGISTIGVSTFVPETVPKERLVAANSRIAGARSAGQIAGPGLASALVQAIGAASAMTADAASYLLSAIAMLVPRISATSAKPAVPGHRTSLFGALRDGWGVVQDRPALGRLAVAAAALNLGGAGLGGLYTYFAYHVVHLSPAKVGITFAAYSIAAITAVFTSKRLVRRVGLTRIIPVFGPVASVALFLIPLATLLPSLPALIAYELVFGFCATVWSISSVTLQQLLSPAAELGRVLGLSRSVSMLVIPVGALLGGALAGWLGTTITLVAFASLATAGTLVVVTVPTSVEPDTESGWSGNRSSTTPAEQ